MKYLSNKKGFLGIDNKSDGKENVVVIPFGLEKTVSYGGGTSKGPKEIIKAMAKIQSQSTSNPTSISQAAAVEALNGTQDFILKRSNSFKERRNFVVNSLNNIKGISCLSPEGAFYVFPDFSYYMGSCDEQKKVIESSSDLCMYILDSTGVVTVSGDSFGAPGYLRLSYATSEKTIVRAVELIEEALSKLSF